MRTVIVGAGATGGALGARLIEAGRDVTFLVRERRADELRRAGLRFESPEGARVLPAKAITASEIAEPFDVVIIAVKAPSLEAALRDAMPAIRADSVVIPLLNGMRQFDLLRAADRGRVVGGLVKIVATLDADGAVRQMTPMSTMTVGSLESTDAIEDIAELLKVPGVDLTVTDDIEQALWEKWAFIAAAGVATCLFRNSIGSILRAGGEAHILAALAETEAVAAAAGHPVSDASHAQSLALLTEPGSVFTSSLYRDLAAGAATEGEHILGDLAARAQTLEVATPLLDLTLVQIRAAEGARA